MGAFQVVFTPRAERDLKKIIRYIARDKPEAAHRFGLELADLALSLSQEYIREAGGRIHQRSDVRKLVHGNYLICLSDR